MAQFPQGAPSGAPVRVCDEGPCVLVVRNSVREDVEWFLQCCFNGLKHKAIVNKW